ncbi:MAG: dTDP-4-dehydrorhamnose 3,5-epimerase [Polyangiaceae bacterium]
MKFQATPLQGAFVVELEPHADERGFFARTFCEREFAAHGLPTRFPQSNLSRNARARTLRGMHFQAEPYFEAKLVRAVSGAIYDVIVDLRRTSPTFLHWFGVELSGESARALFVPERFAHGFLTLQDHTDVFYQMGEFFRPEGARGLRWNDASLGIRWPGAPEVIAERDAHYDDFDPEAFDG